MIEGAKVFPDLRAALADLNFVVATTARERDGFKPVRGPVDSTAMLRAKAGQGERIGIMFGRERFGLDNEEIGLADEIVTFPVDRRFASLNIAQAVLLMAYEWMKSGLESPTTIPFSGPDTTPAPKAVLHGYLEHLEAALQARGYFRPPAKKAKMVDKLRAVLTRPAFTVGELRCCAASWRRSTIIPRTSRAAPPIPPVRRRRTARRIRRRCSAGPAAGRSLPMSERPVLMFDSGVGGLTVLREARVLMPGRRFVYVADDAAFPYGAWEEPSLRSHIVELFAGCSTVSIRKSPSSPATRPRRWS